MSTRSTLRKRPLHAATRVATTLAIALAPAWLLGCGGSMDENDGAQYPVGTSASNTMPASMEALPPSPPVNDETTSLGSEDVAVGVDPNSYADTDPSALTDFQTTLAPYGSWVDDETYGTVWVPSSGVVGADFAPYVTAGHWAYDDDWVWVSDYEWGWAPFHYGRWVWVDGRGWCWIPGRVYRGAWVTWRVGYDGWGYLGWAPLPPLWYWRGGYAVALYTVPPAPYVFCHNNDVFAPAVAHNVVPSASVAAVAGHTRPYVPASPSVDGRTRATPTVNGVNGPNPHNLGIAQTSITRSPQGNVGLLRAQQFAQPHGAQIAGGRAPSYAPPRTERSASASSLAGHFPNGAPRSLGEQTLPTTRSFSHGEFASRGSSIPHIQGYGAGESAAGMRGGGAHVGNFSGYSQGFHSAPSYSSGYSSGFHSSPSYSSSFHSSPSFSGSSSGYSSGFHGGGGFSAPHPSSSSSHFSAPHMGGHGGRR